MDNIDLDAVTMPYGKYRALTGKCETCKVSMKEHPRCEGCGILCGPGHLYSTIKYRGHNICIPCRTNWEILERMRGRRVEWNEFLSPTRGHKLDANIENIPKKINHNLSRRQYGGRGWKFRGTEGEHCDVYKKGKNEKVVDRETGEVLNVYKIGSNQYRSADS